MMVPGPAHESLDRRPPGMTDSAGTRGSLLGGAGLLAVTQYIAAAAGGLMNLIVAALLGPREFGLVGMAMAYPAALLALASFKPTYIVARYVAAFRAEGRREEIAGICKLGFALDILPVLVLVAVVAATAGWVARGVYREPGLGGLMILFAAALPAYALVGTGNAVLNALREFRWMAILQLVEKLATLALVLGLVFAGLGVRGVILGSAAGLALAGLGSAAAATFVLRREGIPAWWRVPLGRVRAIWKEIFAQIGWSYLAAGASGLVAYLPVMILGKFRGAEEAGFYRLGVALTTAGGYVETSLGKVVFPVISERWAAGDREGVRERLRRWTLRWGLPLGGVFVPVIALLPWAIPLLLGERYAPAVGASQILLVGTVVCTVFFWTTYHYYAVGRVDLWTKSYGIYALAVVVLGWLLAERGKFEGMAVIVAAGRVLLTLAMATFALRGGPAR